MASHAVICGIFPDFSTTSLPEKPINRAFRAARREKSALLLRKQPPPPYAPKRLAPLAIAEYVTDFCHIVGYCFGAVSFSRGHENGGAHPRLWRLYGVISRYTYTVQWPIISISAASYGCKGVCNITDFLHHTYGRRLSMASTFMSVGHCMLWWYEQLSQWSAGGTCCQECLAGRGRVALARDGCVGEVVADQTPPHLLSHPNSHIQPSRLSRQHLTPKRNGAIAIPPQHTGTSARRSGAQGVEGGKEDGHWP